MYIALYSCIGFWIFVKIEKNFKTFSKIKIKDNSPKIQFNKKKNILKNLTKNYSMY